MHAKLLKSYKKMLPVGLGHREEYFMSYFLSFSELLHVITVCTISVHYFYQNTFDFHCHTNLDSILKSRDITLPTMVHLVKAMVFPVIMYGCESWTMNKADCQRIDAFEMWCWRRHLRIPWTPRRSNQSILNEISPAHSLEGLILN